MKKYFVLFLILFCAVFFCACKNKSQITVINDNGLYIINIPFDNILKPFVSDKIKTNKDVWNTNKFLLSMNAGYFDTLNGKTTSYVVIDGKTVLNPNDNKNLINNPKLQKNMDKILNRSELRFLSCQNGNKYVIQKHFDEVEDNCKIVHSIQAGPRLLPSIDLEDEYFISRDINNKITRDPIRVRHTIARIAVGIKQDGSLSIFTATNKHPMNLEQLAEYMKNKGIVSAINFDGGGSVSLNYQDIDIFSDYNSTRRPVKSFLIIEKQ